MKIIYIGWILLSLGVLNVEGQNCNALITSEESTIIIPVESTPLVNGSDLPMGAVIQVYFIEADTIQCAGSTIWHGENTYVTVYGKDSDTPGYEMDEAYKFRLILPSGCIITDVETSFLEGTIFNNNGTYRKDGISGLESLKGFSDFEIEIVDLALDTCHQGTGGAEIAPLNQNSSITYEWSNGQQTPKVTGLFEGDSLSVVALDDLGCPAGLSFVVDGKEILPQISLNDSYDYCQGDSIVLSSEVDAVQYEWYFDGELLEGFETSAIEVDTFGHYLLKVTNSFGCEASDSTNVNVQLAPVVSLGGDRVVCQNDTIALDVFCVDCTYLWQSGETNSQINADNIGDYAVTVTSALGCQSSDMINIDYFDVPNGIIIDADTICPGNLATIVIENTLPVQYLWSNGDIGNQISISEAGSYMVSIMDVNDCILIDTIDIFHETFIDAQVTPLHVDLCLGDSLDLIASGGTHFSWYENENEILSDAEKILISPDSNRIYTVVISNTCFSDTLFSNITIVHPLGDAGQDTCAFIGAEVELNASGGIDYFWHENENTFEFNDNTIANPKVVLEDSSTFVVEIIDENGCLEIDSIDVAVLPNDPSAIIGKINFISPNGDGKNDFLIFKNLKKFSKNKLTVFNRWGNVVFETKDYKNDWGGTHKGEELPAASYYYILEVGDAILKSKLSIIRE